MKTKEIHSLFWLPAHYLERVPVGSPEHAIRLSNIRRGVANFVRILTGRDIPVAFSTGKQSYSVSHNGKERVVISADDNPEQVDVQVGLALHEASHLLYTRVNKDVPESTPWFKLVEQWATDSLPASWLVNHETNRGIYFKRLLNFIEDRRIDDLTFTKAIGYRGYYEALYDALWDHPEIGKLFHDPKMLTPTMRNYWFHICNMTNPVADPSVLPGLDEIWKVIDLRNIQRFSRDIHNWTVFFTRGGTVKPAIVETVLKVLEIIERHVDINAEPQEQEDDDQDEGEIDPNNLDVADQIREKQNRFLNGKYKLVAISGGEQQLLDSVEEAGAKIKSVNDAQIGNVQVIVYQKLTRGLLNSPVFHFRHTWVSGSAAVDPRMQKVIAEGSAMGSLLAQRLKVVADERPTRFNRQRHGRLDRRQLAQAGIGADDVFDSLRIERYRPVTLHFTVDASTSMVGRKWYDSMRMAVALAKAADKLPTLNVVVSLRGGRTIPEVLVAYDSRVDRFNHIQSLWPYLGLQSSTPEGLCYAAIMDLILRGGTNERKYFVNISDGAPWFHGRDISYSGHTALEHTARQVQAIRAAGVAVLAYFVSDGDDVEEFKRMYGRDSVVVDVTQVSSILNTLNRVLVTR